MHPQRPSPRTAAQANSLQTNPARTNNPRDPTSGRSSPYSDTTSYSEKGPDDDGDMVMRTEPPPETDRGNSKVNQVIQVPTALIDVFVADILISRRTFLPKQPLPSSRLASSYPTVSTPTAS